MPGRVVIVGAGLAGMVAAITAAEEGVDVVLIDRSDIGLGSNSAMANGAFTGPGAGYGVPEYIRDTVAAGKGLNHEPHVRLIGREAHGAFELFRSLGFPLIEGFGGYLFPSSRPDEIRGAAMVRRLAEKVRSLQKVRRVSGIRVTGLSPDEKHGFRVSGFSGRGETFAIFGSAIVLATGGAGAIYLLNDNQRSTMGQGYHLAAKAGLDLWDMEFVQFYPFVIAEPRLPRVMIYPPYPKETILTGALGEDLAGKYGFADINAAIRVKRDELSAVLFKEGLAGPIRMDFSRVPAAAWDEYPLGLLSKLKFDFRNRAVAISPGAHFFMGGVRVDEQCGTSLQGLFACGEIVWGLHGANRRGGNALTECVVTGRIAGRSAAERARSGRDVQREPERSAGAGSLSAPSMMRELKGIRTRLRETAWECAGVIRSKQGLQAGLSRVSDLEGHLNEIKPASVSERSLKEDLLSGMFVLKGVLISSLGREESRGSFLRSDYPEEDDRNWRRNSRLRYDPATQGIALSFHLLGTPSRDG